MLRVWKVEELTYSQIAVSGPAVSGGEARLGVAGTFGDDGTLAYFCDESGSPEI